MFMSLLRIVAVLLANSCVAAFAGNTSKYESCAANSYTINANNGSGIWPYRSYRSSNAKPPQLLISRTEQTLQPGLIFFGQEVSGTKNTIAEQAALIMTDEGDLVYSLEGSASNFHRQTLYNKSVITLWTGGGAAADASQVGYGFGRVRILDSGYEEIFTVCPKINITLRPSVQNATTCVADVHESYITEDNTLLITVYNTTQADLTSVGGPKDGWVLDSLAVEVDLNTNETLFIWDPLEHVPLNSSHLPLRGAGQNSSNPYDFFHMNSIQGFNGGYLINSRSCWTTYFVSKQGEIQWMVNGQDGGTFGSLPDGGHFSWEHDARISMHPSVPDRAILRYFANDNFMPTTNNTSVALSLSFNYPPSKFSNVTVHTNLSDPSQPIAVFAEGSNNPLANGNHFVGYGIVPLMKEYGPDGEVRWSAQFGELTNSNSSQSYRAFKQDWHATPKTTKPSLVVLNSSDANDILVSCAQGSTYRGFVSWNGATDVTSYHVYTGNSTDTLSRTFSVTRMGFETEFVIPASTQYVQVGAVEGSHEVSRSDVTMIN